MNVQKCGYALLIIKKKSLMFFFLSHAYILLNTCFIFIYTKKTVLFNCVVMIMLHTFYVISTQRIKDVVLRFFFPLGDNLSRKKPSKKDIIFFEGNFKRVP